MPATARSLLAAAAMMLIAEAAHAHSLVDIRMSVTSPAFVAARQRFTYQVVADNLANDIAFGVVVTDTLPPSVAFVKASGSGWNCSESKLKVTCSAESLGPGPHPIAIEVTAPAAPSTITNNVSVISIGTIDAKASNDTSSSTTTIYEPSSCPATSVSILEANSARVSWSPVPNAKSYSIYAAVEGERSALVTTTRDTTITLRVDPGNVELRVEAVFDGCPTASSPIVRFVLMGAPLRLALTALSDSLNRPAGLAFDSTGDLYAADSANNTLVSLAHGVLSSGFNSPIGLAITPNDDFAFIADRANHAIRLRYPGDASLGFVTTIGGLLGQPGYADGLYEVTRFNEPSAIAADPRDRLYVADTGNHRIRKLTTVTGYVGYYSTATFAGAGEGAEDGAALSARFSRPAGIAVDGEAIVFVADTGNHTIRKIENGIVTTIAGRAGVTGNSDGAGDAARFNSPTALAVDARGNLYVCDSGNNTIRKIAPSGVVTTIADGLANPSGIAIDATGAVYISDTANHRVVAGHIADAPPGPRRRAVKP